MEPLEYLRLFRRRWRLIAACVLVATVAGFVTTPAKPKGGQVSYVADASVVRDAGTTNAPALTSVELFMRTGDVPDRVAKRLNYAGNPLKLARSLGFELDDTIGTLTVTASGFSPQEAADLANAFVEETIALLGEQALAQHQQTTQQLNDQVNRLQAQLADIDRQIAAAGGPNSSGTTLLEAQRSAVSAQYGAAFSDLQKALTAPPATAGIKVLQQAESDLASVKGGGFSAPNSRIVRVVLGALLGLLLGVVLLLIIERFDPRLVTRESVEAAFALPIVADVPEFKSMPDNFDIITLTEPGSSVAEGYRSLRAALLLMQSHLLQPAPIPGAADFSRPEDEHGDPFGAPRVVLVTSAAPGDGKSSTVANLAAAFAESGRTVLVLDFDLRKPTVHRYFGVDGGRGILDVLRATDGQAPRLLNVVQRTSVENVYLASHGTGSENFGEVASSGRSLLNDARKLADVVIVDTPPLLATNEAVELIPAADSTVIVCRHNKTTRDAATRSRDLLERLGASVTGVARVGVPDSESAAYGSYYHYRTDLGSKRRPWRRRASQPN